MEEDTWNKIIDIRANGSLSHFLSYFSVMEPSSPFFFFKHNIVMILCVVECSGTLSLIAFFALYLGESIMFPTIFSLALRDAGTKTKLASSLLIMTIVGGAVAPVIMGYIADTTERMAIAFLIPLVCYGVIGGYAAMPRCSSTDVERG